MKDDWVSEALSDDTVVVKLLYRLKHHPSSSSQLCTTTPMAKGLHLTLPLNGWGHSKPRSKPSSISVKKAYTITTRCSPTTPLSWSGGTSSPSDGGYDESSRPPSSDLSSAFRSKGTFTCNTSNISSSCSSKRSKKKRTFTQLKEEENLLLKERVHLKRELASIHETLNEQRVRSENLKRIKFDLNLQSSNDVITAESVSNRCNLLESSRTDCTDSILLSHTMDDDLVSSDSRWVENLMTENQNRGFFLPDLNAMPSEDEIGTLWN